MFSRLVPRVSYTFVLFVDDLPLRTSLDLTKRVRFLLLRDIKNYMELSYMTIYYDISQRLTSQSCRTILPGSISYGGPERTVQWSYDQTSFKSRSVTVNLNPLTGFLEELHVVDATTSPFSLLLHLNYRPMYNMGQRLVLMFRYLKKHPTLTTSVSDISDCEVQK